jgi:hypothetical protein
MITIYFAQTDMTGDLVRYFTNQREAGAWVDRHVAEDGFVRKFDFELTAKNVVDLLNHGDLETQSVYEVIPT